MTNPLRTLIVSTKVNGLYHETVCNELDADRPYIVTMVSSTPGPWGHKVPAEGETEVSLMRWTQNLPTGR